ncbi:MAG: T9SS type A sorting domain-containing protein [Bacteroidia bacterium]
MKLHYALIFVASFAVVSPKLAAQSTCNNQDFEDTTFLNWTGAIGLNPNLDSTVLWTSGFSSNGNNALWADVLARHTIITQNMIDTIVIDPATNLPDTLMTSLAPGGGLASVRLGNNNIGAENEKMVWIYNVTPTNYIFQYQFATVQEDPMHNPDEQPYFMVNMWDSGSVLIPVGTDTFYSGQPNVPFITCPGGTPKYRRWTNISVDLTAYIGQTITIEFINSDCALGGHYAYTYVDVSCMGALVANVWPGDCDYDLQANNVDLLTLGIAYTATGTTRVGASNSWLAQPSVDWTQSIPLGANYKHSDCNGDGLVDLNDTLAITLNYSSTHPFRLPGDQIDNVDLASLPALTLVPVQDTVAPFSYVDVDVYIGSSALPISDLYGLAYTITYNSSLIQPNMTSMSFANSWMGTRNTTMLALSYDDFNAGAMDIGMTRIDQTEISGNGYLGRFRVAVGGVSVPTTLELGLSATRASDVNATNIPINRTGALVVIDPQLPAGITSPDASTHINLFPNPATDELLIQTELVAEELVVVDAQGRVVYRAQPTGTQTKIDLQAFASGIYTVRATTASGVAVQRLVIAK